MKYIWLLILAFSCLRSSRSMSWWMNEWEKILSIRTADSELWSIGSQSWLIDSRSLERSQIFFLPYYFLDWYSPLWDDPNKSSVSDCACVTACPSCLLKLRCSATRWKKFLVAMMKANPMNSLCGVQAWFTLLFFDWTPDRLHPVTLYYSVMNRSF